MKPFAAYRARAAVLGLALLGVWEISVLVSARASAATASDWKSAADAVRARAGPDALIVFAPTWIDPIGRRWLGDRITLHDAARMDSARYPEVWELSVRNGASADVIGEHPVEEQYFGVIRLRRFVRQAPAVVWDSRDRARIHEVDFAPREGILLELHRTQDEARVRMAGVSLGSELHAYAGLADYRRRAANRARVLLTVLVDGREVSRTTLDNDSGWFRLPVGATEPGIHDLELVARAADQTSPAVAAICVAVESRVP